jgi:hypothetical protein
MTIQALAARMWAMIPCSRVTVTRTARKASWRDALSFSEPWATEWLSLPVLGSQGLGVPSIWSVLDT